MPYVILTDVACDVDESILNQADIGFIPMEYSLGNEMRACFSPEGPAVLKAFYDGQRKGDLTKTTQISPLKYEAAMIPWLEKGYSILYLVLSSGLSSTFDTAGAVCENLGRRYPDATILPMDTKAAISTARTRSASLPKRRRRRGSRKPIAPTIRCCWAAPFLACCPRRR